VKKKLEIVLDTIFVDLLTAIDNQPGDSVNMKVLVSSLCIPKSIRVAFKYFMRHLFDPLYNDETQAEYLEVSNV
jgi:hypothetical protein